MKNMQNIFRLPSFFKGVARTSDLFGKLDEYRYSDEPDYELLKKDWEDIGSDLQTELHKYEQNSSY